MTKTTRVRRPFRTAARKPTRREILELLRRIYGPGIPRYIGSPYEGERYNDAEIVLHELGHASLIEGEFPVRVGRMRPSWLSMKQCLDSMPKAEADSHEIRAVAIALCVAKRLGLPLDRGRLTWSGARNSYLLFNETQKFDQLVEDAESVVLSHVQAVLDVIDREWSRRLSSCSPSATRPSAQG